MMADEILVGHEVVVVDRDDDLRPIERGLDVSDVAALDRMVAEHQIVGRPLAPQSFLGRHIEVGDLRGEIAAAQIA
jgi:hypothetical protein